MTPRHVSPCTNLHLEFAFVLITSSLSMGDFLTTIFNEATADSHMTRPISSFFKMALIEARRTMDTRTHKTKYNGIAS